MGRVVRKEIPWDGGTITADIRVWSARERDMHERKYLLGGDVLVGQIIGMLQDPKLNVAKSVQTIRILVDDQRKRAGENGTEPAFDRLATTVEFLALPGSPGGKPTREDIEALDADVFDLVAKAVGDVLYLAPEEKKTSKPPDAGGP